MLSDPDKKQAYDLGSDPYGRGAAGFGQGFSFSDIMDAFFGGQGAGGGRGPRSRTTRGQDALVRLDIDLGDAVFGGPEGPHHRHRGGLLHLPRRAACSRERRPAPATSVPVAARSSRCSGSFLGQVMTTRPCMTCQGFGQIITDPCYECSGDGRVRTRRTLTLKVPAGRRHRHPHPARR